MTLETVYISADEVVTILEERISEHERKLEVSRLIQEAEAQETRPIDIQDLLLANLPVHS